MSFDFVYFFYLINFFSLINGHHEKICGRLSFVALVFRHGERAPIEPYPLDPFSDLTHWPNGWGQLTKKGKLEQYELGQWLRQRYWDFLPLRYNASDIYVQSTDVDRTLMSASCNLAGLYECWNEDDGDGLAWQPIPVHTIPVTLDSVLAAHKKCPAYEKVVQDILKLDEVAKTHKKYREFFSNLSTHSGMNVRDVNDSMFLYSTLNIEYLHGLNLPQWTKDFFPEPLKEMSEFAFTLPCYTVTAKKFKCGPLIKNIVENMRSKISGELTQKMWIYSAHDTTIANLMQCVGVFDGEIPPFTATLIFELFKDGSEYYVKISYKTPASITVFTVPNCNTLCPFSDFERILKPVIPVDWEKECGKK